MSNFSLWKGTFMTELGLEFWFESLLLDSRWRGKASLGELAAACPCCCLRAASRSLCLCHLPLPLSLALPPLLPPLPLPFAPATVCALPSPFDHWPYFKFPFSAKLYPSRLVFFQFASTSKPLSPAPWRQLPEGLIHKRSQRVQQFFVLHSNASSL